MDPYSTEPNKEKYAELDENSFSLFARAFLLIGFALFIAVMCNSPEKANDAKDYWTIWGTRGDFTAGMVGTAFALAGFIYVYLSFKKQREANITQSKAFEHEKVEGRFFQLVAMHRENVSELSFTYERFHMQIEKDLPVINRTKHDIEQRQVFQAIKNQYFEALDELSTLIMDKKAESIYEKAYLDCLKANKTLEKRNIDLKILAVADLVYLVVFFGVGSDGRISIYSQTNGKYQQELLNEVIGMASMKPKVESSFYEKWWRIQAFKKEARGILWAIHTKQQKNDFHAEELKPITYQIGKNFYFLDPFYPSNYEKYYGGHQFRLGHYFRHIFQTIEFIHNQPHLDNDQKYDYIKHLRGQFSTDEQIVFFLNSLSQLGRVWELETKKQHLAIPVTNHLISRYRLIRNIPADHIRGNITLTAFYPDIDFEGF